MPEEPGHKEFQQNTIQILAIDFGLRRIGLAIGNTLTANAQPLKTIHTDKPFVISKELSELISEWQPDKLLMGMPYNADGSESRMAKDIKHFARLLSEHVEMPVEFINESFSSQEANLELKHLRNTGVRKKRVNKGDVDKAAAAVMLQHWLDNYCNKLNKQS